MSLVAILSSGCGYRGTVALSVPEGVDTFSVNVISYDTTLLKDVDISKFLKKYPKLSCMSNEDFEKMGKALIERKSKLDICRDVIITNNKESKSWWEVF